MFQKIKSYFFRRRMNQRIKTLKKSHKVVNLNRARHIGILFDGSEPDNFEVVDKYAMSLEKQRKKVNLLAFIDAAQVSDGLSFPFFLRRDTSCLFAPKGALPKEFVERDFDILINASLTEYEPLEHITTFSNARYRVGPYFEGKTHCFDLMINNHQDSLAAYLEKVNHYLAIIDNPKPNANRR